MSEKTHHILLVEDEEPHVALIRRAFETNVPAVKLLVATSLQEARRHLARATPDLMISDLRLADGDALELLSGNENDASYPVVILTAQGDERIAVEAIKAGALDYVVKSAVAFAEMPHIAERALREWRNIVQRKGAEAALRESEKRFRQLAENIDQVFWLTDWTRKELIYVSPAYETVFGQTRQNLYEDRKGWASHIDPDEKDRVLKSFARSADLGRYVEEKYRILHPDKGWRWIRDRAFPIRDARGVVHRIAGIAEDVTERERAEQKFRDLLESAPDAMVIVDQDGRIVLINAQTEARFGYTREELLGKPVEWLVPEAYREKHPDRRRQYFAQPRTRPMAVGLDLLARRKDGSTFPVEISLSPIETDQGMLVASAIRDITERKLAEEEARQHETELAHFGRLSTMGEMAAGLAHELNQPLSAIMNRAETCLAKSDASEGSTEKLRANIEEIITQTERASQIIRRLRDFVRREKPRTSSTCVNTLIREVHEFVAAEARYKKVAIRLEMADDLPSVPADSIQIEQVVLNLIRNAIEAMDDSNCRVRRLTIQTSSSGNDSLEISVTDTGPGFATDSMDRIFDAFFTTKPDGMGMGLSISRTIVEAHGGRLWASSNSGGGATFHVSLPAEKRSQTAQTALHS